jgi:hypothetical protein
MYTFCEREKGWSFKRWKYIGTGHHTQRNRSDQVDILKDLLLEILGLEFLGYGSSSITWI